MERAARFATEEEPSNDFEQKRKERLDRFKDTFGVDSKEPGEETQDIKEKKAQRMARFGAAPVEEAII